MWARNLLFLGLIVTGVGALTAALFPSLSLPQSRAPAPPEVLADDFAPTVESVNAAFRDAWREQELEPAPAAPELTLARRLSLGLTGTIPSLQEIRQFEARDGDRLQWWLDGVLRDPRCHDYLAERLARAYVGTEDGPFLIYRRRRFVSWLSEQIAANRPYGDVVRDLIARDGIWTSDPAVNFLSVTANPNMQSKLDPERLAGRVARAFLGVRLDCAQCHNHPFEKWKRQDFQGLAAFFGQAESGFSGIHDNPAAHYEMEDRKTGERKKVEPAVPFYAELLPAEGGSRQRLAAWVTHPQNPYLARATVNRLWAVMCGRPLVEPLDDLSTAGDPPRYLTLLADDFTDHNYDLRRLVRLIAATEAFHHDSRADHELTAAHDTLWAAFPGTPLRPEQMAGAVVQAASVQTINHESSALTRLLKFGDVSNFVKAYGDTGEDEFRERTCTISQVLLVMNGDLVKDRTKDGPFTASTRISWQAPDDRSAVETAFLAVFTRRPSAREAAHFEGRLQGSTGNERSERLEDVFWALVNSTEFKWNH
ncbi:MAG TPA: DUF1549 domain-containing protein [Gemmataceae bacterium]|nr:DUF1549 domain-containing protein [Gemmataceae bacterium]